MNIDALYGSVLFVVRNWSENDIYWSCCFFSIDKIRACFLRLNKENNMSGGDYST